jgi:hypothetical protein
MTDFWTSPTLVTTPSESTVPRECDACLSANNRILLELPSEKVVNHYAFGANHYHSGRFVRIAVQLVISGYVLRFPVAIFLEILPSHLLHLYYAGEESLDP